MFLKFLKFVEWLEKEKGISNKSAHDVSSRFRRIQKITNIKDVRKISLEKFEKNKAFQELSVDIRSQLRRAYSLMAEYEEKRGNDYFL